MKKQYHECRIDELGDHLIRKDIRVEVPGVVKDITPHKFFWYNAVLHDNGNQIPIRVQRDFWFGDTSALSYMKESESKGKEIVIQGTLEKHLEGYKINSGGVKLRTKDGEYYSFGFDRP